jgi:nucleoside triphosphate pyrophosphatase
MKLILASASPRRRELLRSLKVPFRVIPSHVSEHSKFRRPVPLVRALALRKAKSIARKIKEGVVLGADTVVVLRGKILGKPRDARHACRMLGRLSGTTHYVYTGVALVEARSGKTLLGHAKSAVRMKKVPAKELRRLSQKHLDKAGAYAIQERRDPIARVVRGSYDNVVGLPVHLVQKMLARLSFRRKPESIKR